MRYNVVDIIRNWSNTVLKGYISKAIGQALEEGYIINNIYIQYPEDYDVYNGPVFKGFTIDYVDCQDIEISGDYAEYIIILRRK